MQGLAFFGRRLVQHQDEEHARRDREQQHGRQQHREDVREIRGVRPQLRADRRVREGIGLWNHGEAEAKEQRAHERDGFLLADEAVLECLRVFLMFIAGLGEGARQQRLGRL